MEWPIPHNILHWLNSSQVCLSTFISTKNFKWQNYFRCQSLQFQIDQKQPFTIRKKYPLKTIQSFIYLPLRSLTHVHFLSLFPIPFEMELFSNWIFYHWNDSSTTISYYLRNLASYQDNFLHNAKKIHEAKTIHNKIELNAIKASSKTISIEYLFASKFDLLMPFKRHQKPKQFLSKYQQMAINKILRLTQHSLEW